VALFLTDNGQDVITNCRNHCDKLKREFQETFDLKSARLIIELLQIELHAKYMAKHVSTNNMNIIRGENYDERESGTDKNSWIEIGTGRKKSLKKTKLSSDRKTNRNFKPLRLTALPARISCWTEW
jgi:hypothetical protein